MPSVSRLSVTPVRSLALHHPDAVALGPHGVADDRRYLILTPDDRLFDGTKHGPLVRMRAELAHDPERLTLHLPDGRAVQGLVELGPARHVTIYRRTFTVRAVIGPWAEAIGAVVGREVTLARVERLPEERDRNPVSVVSEASVHELERQGNDGRPLDPRRFRMLIQLAGAVAHEEDGWIGRRVRIGSEVVVRVTKPDPRCVITTQDPATGERDFPTLHAIKAYRGLRDGRHIDFGVYADVVTPGVVRLGDEVSPLD
jgi:uncharacterized protein YcbX